MRSRRTRSLLEYQIVLDRESKNASYMMDVEWDDRFKKTQSEIVHQAAKYSFQRLLEKLPAGEEYKLYRRAFELSRVTGMPAGTFGAAIYVKPRRRGTRTIDAQKTLLYIQPRRRLRGVRPEIRVLIQHSPWTADTIPFVPKRGEVTVKYRRVSEAEVTEITKKRKLDQRLWRKQLEKYGIRETKRTRAQIAKKLAAVPDFTFTALRLEFGGGGERAKPHWRPSLWELLRGTGLRRLKANRLLQRALTDPDFKQWRRWPTKTRRDIPLRLASTFKAFDKRLGIKL